MKGPSLGTPVFDAVTRDVGWIAATLHGIIARHSRFSANQCCVSTAVLAQESGLSRRTVCRHVSRLEKSRWIIKLTSSNNGAIPCYFCKTPDGLLEHAEPYMGTKDQDAWVCRECGKAFDLTVDHIIPRSKGGTHEPDNLQILCRSCNNRKGNKVWQNV